MLAFHRLLFSCYDHCIVLAELCRQFYGKRRFVFVFVSVIPINNVLIYVSQLLVTYNKVVVRDFVLLLLTIRIFIK